MFQKLSYFKKKWVVLTGILAILISISACSDSSDDNNNSSEDYFPNTDGTTWNYSVQNNLDSTTYESTSIISGTKNFAGADCQVIIDTATDSPNEETRNFVVDTGSDIKNYGYETYKNGQLDETFTFPATLVQFQYPFTTSQTWDVVNLTGIRPSLWDPEESDDFDNDGQADSIDIKISAYVFKEENVSVPAGTFNSFEIDYTMTLVIHASSAGNLTISGSTEKIWFVPKIGVIKSEEYETDGTIIETSVLKSYTIGS